MAGLWSVWRSPAGEKIPTCTIITTGANEGIAPLHHRMPVVLPEETWPAWLGEAPASNEQLHGMLKPLPPDQMQMWPLDRRVGNVKNEGADLAVPISSVSGLWPAMDTTDSGNDNRG